MRIVIYGGSGRVGSRIVDEALERGHEVTAVARDPDKLERSSERLLRTAGDVTDAASIAATAAGHDLAISAIGGASAQPGIHVRAARALLDGLPRAAVPRLIVVGGAGSLETGPGVRHVDNPHFPEAHKAEALGQADALEVYRSSGEHGVSWTYLSPAGTIMPGERSGKFRVGGDQLLVDADGKSEISMEDYAVALLDEAETPQHPDERFTVAY
jgi:putative NADH-flavin reductase